MEVKLCLLDLSRDQADLLTRLQAPTAVVVGAIALETVRGFLQQEMASTEPGDGRIRILVTHFYLEWAIGILRNYQRPPHAELGPHDVQSLHDLEAYLVDSRNKFGNLDFPELNLFRGNQTSSG